MGPYRANNRGVKRTVVVNHHSHLMDTWQTFQASCCYCTFKKHQIIFATLFLETNIQRVVCVRDKNAD